MLPTVLVQCQLRLCHVMANFTLEFDLLHISPRPASAPAKEKVPVKKKVWTSSQPVLPGKTQFMACLGLYHNLVERTGRAGRLMMEEARFQAEMAEAVRLSLEEQCTKKRKSPCRS